MALAIDPTLSSTIYNSNNYSAAKLQEELSQTPSPALIGAAGEAIMTGAFERRPGTLVTSQPGIADADLQVHNNTGGFTISGVASSPSDTNGQGAFSKAGAGGFLAEVKALNPDNNSFVNGQSVLKGATQIGKIAATGNTGVLIVDHDRRSEGAGKSRPKHSRPGV